MTDVTKDDDLALPFGFATTASEVLEGVDLSGKVAVVTGANSGIGFETARALAGAGARVALGGRDEEAIADAAARIRESTSNGDVSAMLIDLADLDSVDRVAAEWEGPLHILVNNAGVMAIPELTRTPQGHEMQFGVNYLGHFALTRGLHAALASAGGARVVCLSSNAHLFSPVAFGDLDFRFRPYDPMFAYAGAKTACVLLAVEVTRRWSTDGILANALNPGAIATGLQKHTGGLKTPVERRKTIEQGAATSVLLAASPLVEGVGGRYFEDVGVAPVRHESPGMFGTGVADFALEPRYSGLLWDIAGEMLERKEIHA